MHNELKSSVELAYRQTRYAIVTGEYPPGSQLRLQELAERNGVSMIPVREALRLLEAEGFVETIPNRGARVTPLSLDDLRDVSRMRIVLELEALQQAAPHITPQVLAKARKLSDRVVHQMQHRGYASYEDHRAFHFLLYEQSHSKWLMRLIGIVWDHTERYRRANAPHVKAEAAGEEHERILDRLAAGDTAGALDALRKHLEGSFAVSLRVYAAMDKPTAADLAPQRSDMAPIAAIAPDHD